MKNLLLLLIFALQLSAIQAPKEILITTESWEDLTNKDGSGLYFDIVRAIYEPVAIEVKFKIVPYNRSSNMVKQKKADLWLGSYIDEEDYALYPKYYFDQDIVTAMFKTSKFPNFKGIKSLKDKNVGWVRGYGYQEYIDVKMKIHERNDRKTILLSLEKDRFDIFLDDADDMQESIKQIKFDTSKYKFIKLMTFKLYPAFRNDTKGVELKKIWDARFKKLLDDGSMKNIFIKNNYEEYFLY